MAASLDLAHGLRFEDLYSTEGLRRVDAAFVAALRAGDPALAQRLEGARQAAGAESADSAAGLAARDEAALLIELGPHVDAFVGGLFGIHDALAVLRDTHRALDPLYEVKLKFVKREAMKLAPGELAGFDADAALHEIEALIGQPFDELAFARAVLDWQRTEADDGAAATARDAARERLAVARRYSAWAVTAEPGRHRHAGDVLFQLPGKVDPQRLLGHAREHDENGVRVFTIEPGHLRRREGFALTDLGTDLRGALDQANYCIWCHNQGKDSCSKGIRDKPGASGEAAWKRSPFGVNLAGCPLEERISEFHQLKTQGHAVAALATIAIDNPMVAATGHRICNDCMKACIYQKQTPVDIPQAETRTLKDVLELPWGFEIYSLLTRWNPLNLRRPLPRPDSGYRVLVVGMGPSGFTLAHQLLNEGHGVVGIDGLKIEPLDESVSGVRIDGSRVPFAPVRDVRTLYEPLGERVMAGFGGVAEYGITVRWDKNFLTLIHLTLARRQKFKVYGGVRFGGALPIEEAWEQGIDHVAIAAGAGRPTIIDIKNNLIRGIRKASDFLMALQLTGAFKKDALSNLQVRLPAVVIGGGLTGVDTATELMAYYPIQVEKTLARHEALVKNLGEARVHGLFDAEELGILNEFLAHGHAVRDERARAVAAGEAPDFISLIRGWGGVTLAYRKRLQDSPAYRLNHEEVDKALEEGMAFAEHLDPVEAVADEHGHVAAMVFTRQTPQGDARVELPARTVLVAAGTSPNVTYEKEHPGTFALDAKRRFFQGYRAAKHADGSFRLEPDANGFFTSHDTDGKFVSYYGDNHPRYHGNVVKAMASAKHGYPHVVALFADQIAALDPGVQPAREEAWRRLVARFDHQLLARVERVVRLTPTIIEVIVKAPAAARHFHPGQFYRLQNFERRSPHVHVEDHVSSMLMEGIALTGAWVDAEQGLLSLITLEMGVSSRLCAYLQPGEPVVVMGPTGTPTEIPADSAVLLAGGGLGNAVLFSIARALKAQGNRVIYFAGYRSGADLFKREEIESTTDQVVWATDAGEAIVPTRPQDAHVRGNIVEAMVAYAEGQLGPVAVPLRDVRRIIAIGSDRMMNAVRLARHGVLAPHLDPGHVGIGSINSPMQCMMKEVCAQCLQRHVDPATGREEFIFSCYNQDQDLDRVDFDNLRARLRQNSVQEKLSNLWLEHVLDEAETELVHV